MVKRRIYIKQQSYFRHVLKINTGLLAVSGWNAFVDLQEARSAGQIISLAESTCIRMIEDIAGIDRAETARRLDSIALRIKELRKQDKSKEQIKELRELYRYRTELQFMPEYLCLVCDTKTEFRRACKGFKVNGVEYERLVGTTGGVKQSTVVFVSKETRNGIPLIDELRRRIDNGRDMSKEFVPAKLEAYRALVCSASSPLSAPQGVLVVDDCITHFKSSYILLKDGETDEPVMTTVVDGDVEVTGSDGYGLMTPGLARRWGYDLKLDYRPAGICVRNSFCKGMVFAFDFHEFADFIAGKYEVKDIWGNTHDIRNVELILTASMLKLWDSYPDWETYWSNCIANGYCFSATKTAPRELDLERRLNYQFIQSYHLSDEDLWNLVEPTVSELTDIMGGDYTKTLLFLRGKQISQRNAWPVDTPWIAALSVEPEMLNDPFVKNQIKSLIKKKITESKFGKLKVHGNFSVISGDPYALCESIWRMPVRGLLKAHELYNLYWSEHGAREVAAFRAPMSSHHNIAKINVNSSWNARHWYQYMDTVTVLNDWDMTTHTLNGADKDGDLIFLTDNQVLVDNVRNVLPIQCEQKKAKKCVPTEQDFIESNILGFGDDIGSVTNRITAQTELQSYFEPGSPEYEELQYRITAGQHVQQNSIDKMKGVLAKPMPKHWYDEKAAAASDDPIDVVICASKKPYFMSYRYPELRSRYLTYVKSTEKKCKWIYGCTVSELQNRVARSDEESNFLEWYQRMSPAQHGKGVMNRICAICENYFKDHSQTQRESPKFDYSILKSETEYSRTTRDKILALYHEYMLQLQSLASAGMTDEEMASSKQMMKDEYEAKCAMACPNEEELCNIVLDICYTKEKSKQFAWDMCSEQILANLLAKNGNKAYYVTRIADGSITYDGYRFELKEVNLSPDEGDCFE